MKWLLATLLILILALVFNLGLVAYAMYALLGALLISRLLTRTWAGNLTAERRSSALTANVGQTVAVTVCIKNDGWLPIPWFLWHDALPGRALMFHPPALKISGYRIGVAMLRGGATKNALYQLTCNRRGYYQIGPVVVETGDLFGLHRRFRVMGEPHFLLVYPPVVPLEGYSIASRRPVGEVRMTYRLFEDPTRIAGIRFYQPGDPLRRVHWRATARTGRLHSKVYEPSTVAGATILLDFHQQSHPPHNEPHRSELAVVAAASIAGAVHQMGQQVGLVTNGRDAVDRIRQEGWAGQARSRETALESVAMRTKSDRLQPVIVPTRHAPDQLLRIVETLARVELTDGLTLEQLIAETESRLPRSATVVAILTSFPRETVLALDNLRRGGYAVTAVLNVHDEVEFADKAVPLVACGIEVLHLKSQETVAALCRRFVLR
jgi:uncharacterized protein (DUF58 family)